MFEGGNSLENIKPKKPELSPEDEVVLVNAKRQVDEALGVVREQPDSDAEERELDPEAKEVVAKINDQIERQQKIIGDESGQVEKTATGKEEVPKKKLGKTAGAILLALAIATGSSVIKPKEVHAGGCGWGDILKHTVGRHLIHDPLQGVGEGIKKSQRDRGYMERTRQQHVDRVLKEFESKVNQANGDPNLLYRAQMEKDIKLRAIREQYGQ